MTTPATKAYFKKAAMAIVYMLHVSFLQAIIADPHLTNVVLPHKTGSSQHQKSKSPKVPVAHWSLLQKLVIAESKLLTGTAASTSLEYTSPAFSRFSQTVQFRHCTILFFNHRGASVFKLYCTLCTFLI